MLKVLPAVPVREVEQIVGASRVLVIDDNGTALCCPLAGGWMISAHGWDIIVTTRRPPVSLERAEAVARRRLELCISDAYECDVTAEPIK